jgi:hypothetical protein
MQSAQSNPIEPMPIIPIGEPGPQKASRPRRAHQQQSASAAPVQQGKQIIRRRRRLSPDLSARGGNTAARRRPSRFALLGAALGLGFVAARLLKRAA